MKDRIFFRDKEGSLKGPFSEVRVQEWYRKHWFTRSSPFYFTDTDEPPAEGAESFTLGELEAANGVGCPFKWVDRSKIGEEPEREKRLEERVRIVQEQVAAIRTQCERWSELQARLRALEETIEILPRTTTCAAAERKDESPVDVDRTSPDANGNERASDQRSSQPSDACDYSPTSHGESEDGEGKKAQQLLLQRVTENGVPAEKAARLVNAAPSQPPPSLPSNDAKSTVRLLEGAETQSPVFEKADQEMQLAMIDLAQLLIRLLRKLEVKQFDTYMRILLRQGSRTVPELKHTLSVLARVREKERPEWIEFILAKFRQAGLQFVYCGVCVCELACGGAGAAGGSHLIRHLMAHFSKVPRRGLHRGFFDGMSEMFGAQIAKWEQAERAFLSTLPPPPPPLKGRHRELIPAPYFVNELDEPCRIPGASCDNEIRAAAIRQMLQDTRLGAEIFALIVEHIGKSQTFCMKCDLSTGDATQFLAHLQSYAHIVRTGPDVMTYAVCLNPHLVVRHLTSPSVIFKRTFHFCLALLHTVYCWMLVKFTAR